VLFVIGSDSIVLLVIKSDSCRMFGPSFVSHSLKKDFSLIDNNVFLDVWIFLIFQFKVVGGESLDGEIGGANGSVFGHYVCSLSNTSSGNVINVGFVSLSHRYDMFIK